MKKSTLAITILCVFMLTLAGCKHKDTKLAYVPEGSFGIEELAAIAQDTTHYRALIFTSPYCYGCRQMNEETQKAVSVMDTSLWRIYYLIIEDIVDSAHWEEVVGDMMEMGISRDLIHHCSLPFGKGMYKDVVALFHTAQPIDSRSRMEGVPFCLAVDTNNYIPVIREKPSPKSDSSWFVVRTDFQADYLMEHSDFRNDDGCFVVETTPTTTADDRTIMINK
ncbi:MAG: hypothetical protein K5650_06770 [Bacteroidales bacterium]|nr:hypothetical protein [Bacteroidales bacterium]